jgi:hypothetical protein
VTGKGSRLKSRNVPRNLASGFEGVASNRRLEPTTTSAILSRRG